MKKLRTTSDLMLQCHHQQLLSIILNSRAELHQSAMKPSNNPWIYVDISLSSVAGRYQIKVTDSQKQTVICENWLPTNYSSVEYLYTARLLETSRIQLDPENDPGQATRYQDIVRYGQKLYKDLFGSDDKFQKYLRKSPHLQTGLRLVLRLHSNAAELWNIPWEYMHDGHSFLVVDQNYTIVRSMLDIRLGETRNNRLPHPLRILVVTSDPIDTPRLNLDQEVGNILEALDTAQKKGLVVVDFVEECTLHNLDAMLEEQDYHIIHYNGHGASTPKGSCLVMEDEDGKALPIFIGDFLPRIRKLKNLRLVVLNGCQTGQVEESQATSGIATGMLQAVPAVVAMQFSIKDVSAQVFARVFYETVASGASLENAMYAARQAMQEKYPVFIDWGVPALYSHHPDIRLIDPKLQTSQLAPLEAPLQIDGLPLPRVFVGRREEQRRLRRVLPALGIPLVYVWGLGGVGKSALVGRILQRPGRKGVVASILTLNCLEFNPRQMLDQIAAWLEPSFPDASAILRDQHLNPRQRIEQAAPLIQQRRMVIVFDRFDALLKETPERVWDLPQGIVRDFFAAIATASWSILSIFTSRYRWALLPHLEEDMHLELHLGLLTPTEFWQMFHQVEHLCKITRPQAMELTQYIGGHPATLLTISTAIAKDPQRLNQIDERFFRSLNRKLENELLKDAFAYMNDLERDTLVSLCILRNVFSPGHVQMIASLPDRDQAEHIMARWEALSLAHYLVSDDEDEPWYAIHPMVSKYALNQCSPEQLKQLHKRAAQMIESDLARVMRERRREKDQADPPLETDFEAARSRIRLILNYSSPAYGSYAIDRALDWRYHFVQSGQMRQACDIALDAWHPVAYRYGNRPVAIEILQETIDHSTGHDQALARLNIARLYEDDGRLDDAMKIYDELDVVFARLEDDYNMARALSAQASVHHRRGKTKKALELEGKALRVYNGIKNFNAAAGSHKTLAFYYNAVKDQQTAMKHIQTAISILKKTDNGELLGSVLHMQGATLRQLKNNQAAYQSFVDAADIAQKTGNRAVYGAALSEMGDMLRSIGRMEDAAHCVLGSIEIAEQLQDFASLPNRLYRLGLVYEMQRNYGEAAVMSERALNLAKQHNPAFVSTLQDALKRQRNHR